MSTVPADRLQIEVSYCPGPGQIDQVSLRLASPCTVADALRESGVLGRHGLALDGLRVGVWSKGVELGTALRDRDRVEIYRPLLVDPKEARRQRYKRHKEAQAARVPRITGPSGTPTR